ncbi:MAG: DUF2190 family protein [Thermomicrobiales bacterium]|nr:DUF2190 family protein [Thermomicrobiales bacterium]
MATNLVRDLHEWPTLPVACSHPTTPASGDPVRVGSLTGVALTDESDGGNATGYTTVDFGFRVWDLTVDDNEGTGIAVWDPIYYHDTGTGTGSVNLNNSATSNDGFFGVALETVSANATTLINVLHLPYALAIALANGAVDTAQLAAEAVTTAKIDPTVINFAEVTLTSAQVKALKATPISLVAAPGANLAIVPVAINLVVNYGGTNAFTESADDLSICYATTPGSNEIKEIESTGLVDQTNDEWRYITFEHAETFIPVENDAVVITNLDDEIAGNAGGDNTIAVRLYYRVVPTDV